MAEKLKIAFLGDVNFSGIFREQLLAGQEIFDDTILRVLSQQNFVVANLEGPATNQPEQKNTGIALHSPPEAIPYLAARNIKVFDLANNHLFDHGSAGFEETVTLIEKHGGQWFGAGRNIEEALRPLELSGHGISRGLMGIAHYEGMIAGSNSAGVLCETSEKAIGRTILQYQKGGKQMILNYHGGEEYTRYPVPARRERLQKLALNAQAWVVAHHSHTLQGVETIKGQPVFYSLGNAVFDLGVQADRGYINDSAILLAEFDEEGGTYAWLPIHINRQQGRIEARPFNDFKQEMAQLCEWAQYESHWLREAHRVFWMTRSGGGETSGAAGEGKAKSTGLFHKVFKPSAWRAMWYMYRNPHTRPIAMGALAYALKQKGAGK